MSKLSEIFNREIDLIKKDENTLGIVLVGSSKDLDFEKDIKINDIDLFIFTKEQDENHIRIDIRCCTKNPARLRCDLRADSDSRRQSALVARRRLCSACQP